MGPRARSKFGASHDRTRSLSEANVLYLKEVLSAFLGLLGAAAVIRRPGICAPPPSAQSVVLLEQWFRIVSLCSIDC